MFNHNSFSATSFNAVSWRFDLREQTITYARVAAHVRTGQEVVFAYSQESLRVATKVSYPVAFVTTLETSAHVKPVEAKAIAGNKARIKESGGAPYRKVVERTKQLKPASVSVKTSTPIAYSVTQIQVVTAATKQPSAFVVSKQATVI